MTDLLVKLGPWSWLIAGFVLMALEMVAPGVFMFWLGAAAVVTGLLSFAIDWSWQAQCFAFAILSLAAVPLWRRDSDNTFLNRRSDALVGQVFTLEKPIVDGSGTVRVGDTFWRVAGPDAPAGARVKVVHADGASLTVAIA